MSGAQIEIWSPGSRKQRDQLAAGRVPKIRARGWLSPVNRRCQNTTSAWFSIIGRINFEYSLGIVFQVGVLNQDDVACSCAESGLQRDAPFPWFASCNISRIKSVHRRGNFFQDDARAVGASVVNQNQLAGRMPQLRARRITSSIVSTSLNTGTTTDSKKPAGITGKSPAGDTEGPSSCSKNSIRSKPSGRRPPHAAIATAGSGQSPVQGSMVRRYSRDSFPPGVPESRGAWAPSYSRNRETFGRIRTATRAFFPQQARGPLVF